MTARDPSCQTDPAPHVGAAGERIVANESAGPAALTICVPAYKHDAARLVAALAALPGALRAALVIYDDGSADPALEAAHARAVRAYPGPARLVVADRNLGRSHARNRLAMHAETRWLLLLDADMLPDGDAFLTHYFDALAAEPGPALIAGGFSLLQVTPSASQRLHAAQARRSDCLSAEARRTAPGRFVFTSNILVHRDVLEAITFDEGFTGWGWEDVDWGLRVAAAYPVRHIDNTATHTGLEPDARLIAKFGTSGENFARLAAKHPAEAAAMPLMRAARRVKGIPFVRSLARTAALSQALPEAWRVFALKLFRASVYAAYIPAR